MAINTEQTITKSDIISFDKLYDAMIKCQRGVSWKASVAHFILNCIVEIQKLSLQLQDGSYEERDPKHFKIYIPKEREIVSISFRDRVYQRSLNDNAVFPECSKHLIYDNCACQKGKGTDFARNRLKTFLHRFYRHHKTNGYVLQIDIHGYYPNMRHDIVKNIFKKYLSDEIYEMVCPIIDTYKGDIGFNPGSQLIQIAGITLLSPLDHFIKEDKDCGVDYYLRYMDDSILISESKEKLTYIKNKIESMLKELGFEFNPKKTKIYKVNKGIEFLGFKFILDEKGKVLQFVLPEKVKKDRRNIKQLANFVKNHTMTVKQYYDSWTSRRAHYEHGDSKTLLTKMDIFVRETLRNAISN